MVDDDDGRAVGAGQGLKLLESHTGGVKPMVKARDQTIRRTESLARPRWEMAG